MVVIKHCHKCGAVPELIRVGDLKEYFIVKCPECYHTEAKYDEASITERDAIRIWNKRSKNHD